MNSVPGFSLEEFLAWNLDLVVSDGPVDTNNDLCIVESNGIPRVPRKHLTTEQFKSVVALYEPYRLKIERKLHDFDEEGQVWRNYAGTIFEVIPTIVDIEAVLIIRKCIGNKHE